MNSENISKGSMEKRKKILEGAIAVFTEKGFEGASMDKIAQKAGVSKITIYKHFQNKESLFIAIVSKYIEETKGKKPIAYSSDKKIESQLHAFIEAELERVIDSKQRGISRLLTSVYIYRPDLVKATMKSNPFFVDFIAWLKSAEEDGKIRTDSELVTAQIFYGMIQGCLTWNALLTDGESLIQKDVMSEEIIVTFLDRYGCKELKKDIN